MKYLSYVDGEWIGGTHSEPNINPSAPAEVIGMAQWATPSDVEAAFAAARRASRPWAEVLPAARAQMLRFVADELLARADELGRLLALEEGKTLREGIAEVRRSADIFHFYAGECVRGAGEFLPGLRAGVTVTVSREPIGVAALITAWNFPMMLPAMKIAAALAYGNTVVFKPSEFTPGCAVALTEIISRSHIPRGVFNLVLGAGIDLGPVLIQHADGVSFTGSTGAGRAIVEQASKRLVKVQAEMGGKNPLIVDADANLDFAAEIAVQGMFHSTGQKCTATSRLIVMSSIYAQFIDKLIKRIDSIAVGDALSDKTEMGPVANEAQLKKNLSYVDLGQQEGATLVRGGRSVESDTAGYFMLPTLFVDTTSRMRINQEEIFGPVAAVMRAHDLDEAIHIANDVEFGLSSGICTQNLLHAEQFRRRSKAGMVMINAPTSGADFHVPLGGQGQSGYGGKELGSAAIDFYTETKTAYVNTAPQM
ncbi:aldehyde dehydrogenase family protein [Noviherbaspirillum sedimenti]|uniref:Aldehyde dehydrogenase family protein n=2 Tax=Noviherbaspirillum sedimenti TaxID=2320865 RepID=A0A3A3GQ02_9BURK|nr:aldehyde dehydrogenase family protein [Noviherbaspirillum sedimenti]